MMTAALALMTMTQSAFARPELAWESWRGRLPRNAIQGGVDANGSVPLYICRARHINGVHPGKLLNRECHIGWGGKEVILRQFEVLVWRDGGYRGPAYRYR